MTIKEYITGLFTYQFSEANLASVFAKRGVLLDAEYSTVSVTSRDLLEADLLMILATTTSEQSETTKVGNWSKSSGGAIIGVNDRLAFKKSAQDIYKKYGEGKYSLKDKTYRW